MKKPIVFFSAFHFLVLISALRVQLYVGGESLLQKHLLFSYLLNGGFSLGILLFIYLFQNRFKDKLGFVFMGASMAKFAILMVIFRFVLMGQQESFERNNFFIVFVPYALSLATTTFAMTKII